MADNEKKEKAPKEAKPAGGGGGEKKPKGKKGPTKVELAKPTSSLAQDRVEPRAKKKYDAEVIPALMRQFNYKNKMQVPRITKVTVNMGLGEATQNQKLIESGLAEVTALTGQKPVVTRARKSIATFKLRTGQPIGVMVTLRRDRMWEFLDRLITFALPRVRDFKGVSPKAFDGQGNYTLGLKEQIIFPEIDYDKVDKIKGLNISIVTTARNDEEGRALLQQLGMPFRQ
jgi:large subunit ribosomal protein L5